MTQKMEVTLNIPTQQSNGEEFEVGVDAKNACTDVEAGGPSEVRNLYLLFNDITGFHPEHFEVGPNATMSNVDDASGSAIECTITPEGKVGYLIQPKRGQPFPISTVGQTVHVATVVKAKKNGTWNVFGMVTSHNPLKTPNPFKTNTQAEAQDIVVV